jgi:5-methylcytosine-specific restriction endonuclease McrA
MSNAAKRRDPNRGANGSHGSKWIRPEKRARIYARDGWACVWCGFAVAPGTKGILTLDHLVSRARGGSNDAKNLVTACLDCNSARGTKSALEFVAELHEEWHTVLERVLELAYTELPK